MAVLRGAFSFPGMDKTIEHQTTKATMKRRSTPQPLTRVDVWHLENVLFKLYRTIQSCVETVGNATITATGGYRAAAIGMSGCIVDSYYPDLKIGKIHISYSVITAQGGDGAAAIGLACMEDAFLSSAYADEIYIETDETSAVFLGRLTSSGNFKIGKGKHYSDRMTFYNQDGSGTWPGVTLKASDGTQTSPDGIGQ